MVRKYFVMHNKWQGNGRYPCPYCKPDTCRPPKVGYGTIVGLIISSKKYLYHCLTCNQEWE